MFQSARNSVAPIEHGLYAVSLPSLIQLLDRVAGLATVRLASAPEVWRLRLRELMIEVWRLWLLNVDEKRERRKGRFLSETTPA